MSNRLAEIARRKQALIERCAAERTEIDAACRQLLPPLHPGTALAGIVRLLKNPLVTGGISSLLVSGYSGTLTRSAGNLVRLGRLAMPVWAWINKRGKHK